MNTVIITLTWNGTKNTVKLLRSLSALNLPYPIWVIDNGSTVDESDMMKAARADIDIIRLPENKGFAGGMNFAIHRAVEHGFEFVYEINNDCLVNDDVITPCLQIAERNPSVAIIGSRYLSKDDQGDYSKWGFHSDPSEFDQYIHGFLPTDRVVGCGMLIRCHEFMKNGGFDDRFFCYGEEIDACWRLLDIGMQIGICMESLVLHDHQGSDIGNNAAYYRIRNLFLLKQKHPERCRFFLSELTKTVSFAWKGMVHANVQTSYACTQGIFHGVLRKYGKRTSQPHSIAWMLALIVLTVIMAPVFLARLFIKKYRHTVSVRRTS